MNGDDMLAKVRRAVRLADSIHLSDAALAERLLEASERWHGAQREFLQLLDQFQPASFEAEQARRELRQQASDLNRREELLHRLLLNGDTHGPEIHTRTPPNQVQ